VPADAEPGQLSIVAEEGGPIETEVEIIHG
jgi:hypothetical protein